MINPAHEVQTTEVERPNVDKLNVIQRSGYESAKAALSAASERGYIDLSSVHRILDFGSGLGGPTLGVVDATSQYSPHIDAVEQEQIWVDFLNQSGILPPQNIIHENGIAYLQELAKRDVVPYDLITAFKLGPDGQGRIFRGIASAAATALNPNCSLLVTSDDLSMNAAKKACQEANVPFYLIDEITEGQKKVQPATLVLPQSSCSGIKPLEIIS